MHSKTLLAVVATLAGMHEALAQSNSESLYSKNSAVTQINSRAQLDRLINQSNRTSIIEFYAPWCGHCKNLKPDYEKAARSLDGLANVVAVNCEEARETCASFGVEGFPTLKIARPPKVRGKGRRTVVDNYNGQRTAAAIVESVTSQMNNHVVKVTDATLDEFLSSQPGAKALLFTEKGTTAPSTKALATDFLGSIAIGQVRNKEAATVDKYGVTTFPALLLLTGDDDAAPIAYEGKFKLAEMTAFLSQAAEPNPPLNLNGKAKTGKSEKSKEKKEKETKEKKTAEKKAEKEKETTAETADAETETSTTETPTQQTAPVIVESALPVPTIHTAAKLQSSCFSGKAPTCVLVFVGDASSDEASADTQTALDHLAEVAHKYAQNKRALFPFFAVPASNPASAALLGAMEVQATSSYNRVQLVAVNGRRSWWRKYEGGGVDLSQESIEQWIDDIRMGEGTKHELPEGVITTVEKLAETKEEAKDEAKDEAKVEVKEEAKEEAKEVKHEEL
ncbi:protein disulfide-isomerase A6 [Sporothrix schenckii 1099-18]|uniref:protein disulfide-isomerase n=1 Tax=Sporothrix schenckii 1099-18 TaxID=1397361 RepID=A0A0F2MEJ5_SPOSC|nr:protein disulfide-isomerase A6 [Sporothrix schenckii 1099-18]KJR87280.1 protein disulfide-isomerase A6 [Sporothrix schenckii 1099-18]